MAELLRPDKILADLEKKFAAAKTEAERQDIRQQINERQSEIAVETGVGIGVGFGAGGSYTPSNLAAGTEILQPTYEQGVFTKTTITDDRTKDPYGRAEVPTKITFYNAEGKPLSAAEAAKTETGLNMAAAGRDIGFGPGFIAPGVKPDIEFATFNSTRANMPDAAAAAGIVGGPSITKIIATDESNGNTSNAGYRSVDGKLYFNGILFTGSYNGQNYENGVLKTTVPAGTMTSSQQDVYSIIVDRLNRYNLASLAPLIKKLAIEGATEATIMLRLQEEPLYQERFKANQSRITKGLKALTPSEYLTLEDDYRQVLRAYGLKQFDNDAYVSQFLANDISVSELSNRVVAAVQRVRNADPAISSMLKSYYGISNNDLVAYVLDPNQQFQKIERQIAASEIGVAAGRQGINIGVPVAEQLAAQGVTQAEAQRGYATIADILPTAQKLSDIYGKTLEGYGLAEAEQEVFNQLASAQRKRRALTEREVAAFSGTSGLGRTSLTQQSGGQF